MQGGGLSQPQRLWHALARNAVRKKEKEKKKEEAPAASMLSSVHAVQDKFRKYWIGKAASPNQIQVGPVRFGYGSCMGWFERFRAFGFDGFLSGKGFSLLIPSVPVPVSVPEKPVPFPLSVPRKTVPTVPANLVWPTNCRGDAQKPIVRHACHQNPPLGRFSFSPPHQATFVLQTPSFWRLLSRPRL